MYACMYVLYCSLTRGFRDLCVPILTASNFLFKYIDYGVWNDGKNFLADCINVYVFLTFMRLKFSFKII